jgi:hypothetical protein
MERGIQARLDDFEEEYDEREALNRIRQNHTQKMAAMFNEIFQKLFNEKYTREV